VPAAQARALTPVKIILETPRLFFREMSAEDLPVLLELDSDPEVMRFISQGLPTPRATYEHDYLPRMLSHNGLFPPRGFWAAHLREGGEFIGWFHLRPDKITPEEMELGYRLKRSAWGRGLATEGTRALIAKAFAEWGWHKLSARTLTANVASRRVMEKSGLKFEHDFIWSEEILPGWPEAERRGVKYSLQRPQNYSQ
jgi:RimJ/RimL family protein N-acetyltransferase